MIEPMTLSSACWCVPNDCLRRVWQAKFHFKLIQLLHLPMTECARHTQSMLPMWQCKATCLWLATRQQKTRQQRASKLPNVAAQKVTAYGWQPGRKRLAGISLPAEKEPGVAQSAVLLLCIFVNLFPEAKERTHDCKILLPISPVVIAAFFRDILFQPADLTTNPD